MGTSTTHMKSNFGAHRSKQLRRWGFWARVMDWAGFWQRSAEEVNLSPPGKRPWHNNRVGGAFRTVHWVSPEASVTPRSSQMSSPGRARGRTEGLELTTAHAKSALRMNPSAPLPDSHCRPQPASKCQKPAENVNFHTLNFLVPRRNSTSHQNSCFPSRFPDQFLTKWFEETSKQKMDIKPFRPFPSDHWNPESVLLKGNNSFYYFYIFCN